MRRLLVLTVAAATVAVVVVTSTGSAQPGGRTITVIEKDRAEKQAYVDNPPRGTKRHPKLSAGDLFTMTGPVFDQTNKAIGELDAVFTTLTGARHFSRAKLVGHGAFRLEGGSIAIDGTFAGADKPIRVAVLGGTEAYEGVRGSVTITQTKTGSVDAIHLLP